MPIPESDLIDGSEMADKSGVADGTWLIPVFPSDGSDPGKITITQLGDFYQTSNPAISVQFAGSPGALLATTAEENQTVGMQLQATGGNGQYTWAIAVPPGGGGSDALENCAPDYASVSINQSGLVSFLSAPDFETPTDYAGTWLGALPATYTADNAYTFTVKCTSDGISAYQNCQIVVTDVAEGGLGPELWPQPDFDSSSGFGNVGTGWAITGGFAVGTATNSSLGSYTLVSIGTTYEVTLTYTHTSGGPLECYDSGAFISLPVGTGGTETFQFVAAGTGFFLYPQNVWTGSVGSLSLKEVL